MPNPRAFTARFPLDRPHPRHGILRVAVISRIHVVVRGRVQGVGFRAFVLHRAEALGISGWVRNRVDGAVELEAEGEPAALDRLVDAVARGPAGARVTEVEREFRAAVPGQRGFRLKEDWLP